MRIAHAFHFVSLSKIQESLRTSLWFAPAFATVAALAAAQVLVGIDRTLKRHGDAWFIFGGEAESARELLSTITSSMITFTGVVFSITILVLQLASGQFSPRVLRTFLEDRTSHVAMASFVGTFIFAIAVLAKVRTDGFVPGISVFVAMALVVVSTGVFIHYINHMGHAVRAITIIKRVSAETHHAIDQMYPDRFEDADHDIAQHVQQQPPTRIVRSKGRHGVLRSVDEDALMQIARDSDVVLQLVPMPGDFVPHHAPLFLVWSSESSSDVDEDALRDALDIAAERSPDQDPAFGFRQLVDIAERALSPGVNDPSTAVQALDEIHDLLRLMSRRRFPSPNRQDGDTLRLILPRPDWHAYVHLGLDEVRQYGVHSVQIARRLRAVLEDCLTVAPPARRAPLEEQLRLLDERLRELPQEERAIARRPSAQGHGQE